MAAIWLLLNLVAADVALPMACGLQNCVLQDAFSMMCRGHLVVPVEDLTYLNTEGSFGPL
jgi:hypothetical protein